MKKYLNYILAFMIIVVMTLTGCGNSDSGEDNAGPGNVVGNITEKVAKVNPNGSLDLYTQSGVNIKAQEKTFDSDVRVKVTESKLSEGLSGDFSKISNLFTISAEKVENTSLGEKVTSVTSVEKPVIITVPNNTTKEGVYYLGTRPNPSQPWKYKVINSNNSPDNPLVISSRFAATSPSSVFYVSTYNVDFQFAVFVETTDKPIDSKTVISDIKASAEPSEYTLENGYYKSDLTVKTSIYGDNIGNLSASDYIVEIGFLNDDWYEYNSSTFPIVGASAYYEVSEAGAGAGNKYKHTITLKNISDYSNNTLSFIIGASKLTRKIFPDNFTVTISVDGKSDVIACENTKGIILTDKTSQDDPQKKDDPTEEVTYIKVVSTSPANSETGVATDSKSVITIEFEKELNPDTYWGRYVTMTNGSEQIPLIYEYDKKVLTLKHSIIPSDQVYTVRISEGIEGAEPNTRVAAYAFAFSTGSGSHSDTPVTYINVISASVENGATDVATAPGNITIKFDKELTDNDWGSFVTLTGKNGNIPVTVAYSNKTLTISHSGLEEDTPHTLLIKGGMKGVEENTETAAIAMAFSTVKPAKVMVTAAMQTPSITSEVGVSTDVVIAFSEDIKWEKESENLVTLLQGTTQIECGYNYANEILTMKPAASLAFNKTYTVMVSKYLTPLNANAEMQKDFQFEFSTVTSEGTPSITSDTSKSADGKYYLVADQKFSIDFNKVIINEEAAKQKIYMQKDGAFFHDYSVEFDAGMQIANINVSTAFEADKTYKVGVTEFTDNDGSIVKAAESQFTAMPAIALEGIEVANNSNWIPVSSSDVDITGKIRAVFSQPVEPSAVRLLNKNGDEITDPIITNKTSEKNKIIAFDYDGFYPMTNYSIAVSYTDAVTGQSVENSTVSFITSVPDHLVLADTTQPNSEDNPYLIYCAAALDQIREDEYLAQNYYFKQMADIDLNPEVYNTSANNTQDNGWKPFGRIDPETGDITGFIGHYNGNGMKISNMKAYDTEHDTEAMSLFGAILIGSVTNLSVEDVDINGVMCTGAIAGFVGNVGNVRMENCHSSGNITCQVYAGGGIIGKAEEIIMTNCDSSAKIECKDSDSGNGCIGGLAGAIETGYIVNCHATGDVKGYATTGGLVGQIDYGNIIGCYTSNNIEGSINVGGLVGWLEMDATIEDCQSKNINLKASEDNSGGIVGMNNGLIKNCHSSGNIEGNQCVGGVVGRNDGEVYRSDSECIIDGEFAVGGIIGESFGYVSPYDTDDSGDYDKIKFYGKVEGVETDDPTASFTGNKSIYIGMTPPA